MCKVNALLMQVYYYCSCPVCIDLGPFLTVLGKTVLVSTHRPPTLKAHIPALSAMDNLFLDRRITKELKE